MTAVDDVRRASTSGGARVSVVVSRVRRHLSSFLVRTVCAWCGVAVMVLLGLAPLLAGDDGWRAGSPLPVLLCILLIVVIPFGVWLWRTLGRVWCRDEGISAALDVSAGLPKGTVFGSLELSRQMPPGTSQVLRDMALARVGGRLLGDASTLSGSLGATLRRGFRRSVIVLLAALALPVLALSFEARRAIDAWAGVLRPWSVLAQTAYPPVSVEPGTVEVQRGASVDVIAHAPGRDRATLHWVSTGQVEQSQVLRLTGGSGSRSLSPIASETRYWIETPDGAASARHRLTPVDPLFVSDYALELSFPPHTGMSPVEYDGDVPALALPRGSRVRIAGSGSRDIHQALILDSAGSVEVPLTVSGRGFVGEWVPARSGTYGWSFTDNSGAPAASVPGPIVVDVVEDRPPEAVIVFPAVDTMLPLDQRQPLVIQVSDDYGLSRLEIVSTRITAFGELVDREVRHVQLGELAAALARPVLDLSAQALSPGDTVRYFARVLDNHPARQEGQSVEYALWVGGAGELERAAGERLEDVSDAVEALAGAARDMAEGNPPESGGARTRRDGRPRPPGFAEREEVQKSLERQQELFAAVDSLRNELADLRAALERSDMVDPEVSRRMGELEDLLDSAVPDGASDDGAETERRLEDMDSQEMERVREDMALDGEMLRERLEESLQQFRDAVIEQGFRTAERAAEDLAREQQILADAMAEGGGEGLRSEQQEALEGQADALHQQLEGLEERLRAAGEREAEFGVRDARSRLDQAREAMQRAGSMMAKGEHRSAGQEAAQAAGDLSHLADQLDDSRNQMFQEQMAQIRQALSETASDALALARNQTDLRDRMQRASVGELAGMRSAEAAIAQGIRNLAENYAAGTGMAAPGARNLLTAVGEAMERLDETLEAMGRPEGRTISPVGAAEEVVRSLNRVAQLAMASGQNQGQASGAASEQMQQIQHLAQQQGEIMQDASALTPMQLGEQTMAEQVGEMSARQDEVARELGELSQRNQEGSDPLGDLSSLAEEAERLATALAQGRLDPEVLRRQERLFHRLLDAGRTLERDEESDERESDRPGAFVREAVDALRVEDLDALRFSPPGGAALRALPMAQRTLVIRYFERLNRIRGGGGS